MEALARAQAERSVEGALRAAAAFDGLGDAEMVERCVRIAEVIARQRNDAAARQQVLRARARFVGRLAGGEP